MKLLLSKAVAVLETLFSLMHFKCK